MDYQKAMTAIVLAGTLVLAGSVGAADKEQKTEVKKPDRPQKIVPLGRMLDERPDPELDDERRRYYHLSELGRRVVLAEAERLAGQVRAARKLKFRESSR